MRKPKADRLTQFAGKRKAPHTALNSGRLTSQVRSRQKTGVKTRKTAPVLSLRALAARPRSSQPTSLELIQQTVGLTVVQRRRRAGDPWSKRSPSKTQAGFNRKTVALSQSATQGQVALNAVKSISAIVSPFTSTGTYNTASLQSPAPTLPVPCGIWQNW